MIDVFWQMLQEGWKLLVAAIVVNLLATKFGLTTWNSFFQDMQKYGFQKTIKNTNLQSFVFMFIIYPGILGYVILRIILR